MNHDNIIGLPLDTALLVCAEKGFSPQVIITRSPKDSQSAEHRAPRVIAIRGDSLIVAYFSTLEPEAIDDGQP